VIPRSVAAFFLRIEARSALALDIEEMASWRTLQEDKVSTARISE
jgi:hypothetical protein